MRGERAEELVRGVDRGIESMVKDAERMLNTLTLDVERTGSPAPGVIPEPPAVEPDEPSRVEPDSPVQASGSTAARRDQ